MFIHKHIYEIPVCFNENNSLLFEYRGYDDATREHVFYDLNKTDFDKWCKFSEEYLKSIECEIIHHEHLHKFYQ